MTRTTRLVPFGGHETWVQITAPDDARHGALPLFVLHGGPGMAHNYVRNIAELAAETGRTVVHYDQIGWSPEVEKAVRRCAIRMPNERQPSGAVQRVLDEVSAGRHQSRQGAPSASPPRKNDEATSASARTNDDATTGRDRIGTSEFGIERTSSSRCDKAVRKPTKPETWRILDSVAWVGSGCRGFPHSRSGSL